MIFLFLLPAIALTGITNCPAIYFSSPFFKDTTSINHWLDGNTTEWPAEKFKTNKETKISYAADNDNLTLFLALQISDIATQKKIMQQGMNLYIDTKGKKKENRGVEFPVTEESFDNSALQTKKPATMKLFGFSRLPPFSQPIKTEGTINIGFAWDSSYVMHIGYNIPLKMLEESLEELNNKNISVGWKIKGNEMADKNIPQATKVVTTLEGRPVGGGAPVTRNAGPPLVNVPQNQKKSDRAIPAQTFWTTHTIVF